MKIRETSAKIFADKYLNQILTKREEAIVKEVVAGKLETATTITLEQLDAYAKQA